MPCCIVAVFVVYWCYGTQLSVNGSATSDFWGTKNAGINYGMLFTAWGVAGIIGPRIGGVLFDKYKNYQAAFYTAAGWQRSRWYANCWPSVPQFRLKQHSRLRLRPLEAERGRATSANFGQMRSTNC